MKAVLVILALLIGVEGYSQQRPLSFNIPRSQDSFPAHLSETRLFSGTQPHAGLTAYCVNVPFYSDGAEKSRWILLPPDTRIRFDPQSAWTFPPGTLFIKQFEHDHRPLETRLLVRDGTAQGVYGATYRWRADLSDADLVTTRTTTEGYTYPAPADCRSCHTDAAGGVLGVNARQWNRGDQLTRLASLFENPPRVLEDIPRMTLNASAPISIRVRSYLDANCAHCHNATGSTLGDFDARFSNEKLLERASTARVHINLGVDHARLIAPRDPWRSVMLTRLTATDQPKMPPLGHNRPDPEGVTLLTEYIHSLPGPDVLAPPVLQPAGGDFDKPLTVSISHGDSAAVLRYTLDGSAPTSRSAEYGAPILLSNSATLRVRAFKPGMKDSVIAQDTYVIEPKKEVASFRRPPLPKDSFPP